MRDTFLAHFYWLKRAAAAAALAAETMSTRREEIKSECEGQASKQLVRLAKDERLLLVVCVSLVC